MDFRNQKEMFFHIWEEREHVCDLCGDHLGDEPLAFHFSHILSKGAYPRLKLNESNIMLNCFPCHAMWDHGSPQRLKGYKEMQHKKEELKLKYNTGKI